MRLLFGEDVRVAQYVSERLGVVIVPPYTAIGILSRTRGLVGGVVFNDYNGANVEMTFCGDRAITRDNLCAVFRYVFEQMSCARATARTQRSNKAMRHLLLRLGFRHEFVQPRYYGRSKAHDAFIFAMMAEECPWTSPNEDRIPATAA